MSMVARLAPVALLLVAAACGGSDSVPSPTPEPSLNVDPGTLELWSDWADRAQQQAVNTSVAYTSQQLTPGLAEDLQDEVRGLAGEIRSTDPPEGAVSKLVESLDSLDEALEFGLEYAENAGLPLIRIDIPILREAIRDVSQDASDLGNLAAAD